LIKGLFKLEYNIHDYAILLKKDSLKPGDEFYSSIYVTNPKHKIVITSPTQEVISSEGERGNPSKGYSYKTEKEGVYDFKGTIEYDTIVAPFEYKFIVVKKD
jgi:hypothetical protein